MFVTGFSLYWCLMAGSLSRGLNKVESIWVEVLGSCYDERAGWCARQMCSGGTSHDSRLMTSSSGCLPGALHLPSCTSQLYYSTSWEENWPRNICSTGSSDWPHGTPHHHHHLHPHHHRHRHHHHQQPQWHTIFLIPDSIGTDCWSSQSEEKMYLLAKYWKAKKKWWWFTCFWG